MKCRMIPLAAITVVAAFAQQPSFADNWPRFRGPNGAGVSTATTIPTKWTEPDINWKVDLPGYGHGSPVVWENRLFVQCDEDRGQERLVVCVDTSTGKRAWTKAFPAASHKKHRHNSFASSTPAVDKDRVYATWAVPEKLTLIALTHSGDVAWEADLGPFKGGHGFAASPIVYGDMVVLCNDQDGKSSLIAVDAKTGAVRWNVPRRSLRATYSTPCVYKRDGRAPELIFTDWQHGITGIDPATGKTNWEISVFDVDRKERAIGSPVIAGELLIGSCGFTTAQKHIVAVRPGDSGKPDDVEEVYRIERNVPHIPTLLVHKNRLYLWSDKGIVTSHDATSGKMIWQQRVGGNYFGSPVCVDDRLFCIDDTGTVVVLAAADEFKELARNPLGQASHTTPAIANGTMFYRTTAGLFSIGGKK